MKRRELVLLLLTVLIIGLGVYLFMSEEEAGVSGGGETAVAGDLATVREKFAENLKLLKKGKPIDEQYNQLSVSLDDARIPNIEPEMAAQNQLYVALAEKLGVQNPTITNSKPVPIKNVDEYYFINITFKAGGTEAEMKKLLFEIERLGFLIQSFRLAQLNRGQNDYLEMEVTVSKLVKHDKKSKEKMNPTRGRRVGMGR